MVRNWLECKEEVSKIFFIYSYINPKAAYGSSWSWATSAAAASTSSIFNKKINKAVYREKQIILLNGNLISGMYVQGRKRSRDVYKKENKIQHVSLRLDPSLWPPFPGSSPTTSQKILFYSLPCSSWHLPLQCFTWSWQVMCFPPVNMHVWQQPCLWPLCICWQHWQGKWSWHWITGRPERKRLGCLQ